MNKSLWQCGSLKSLAEIHISDYTHPFEALYEYTKNLEDSPALANLIYIEFLPKTKTILIYGNGKGLDIPMLDTMQNNIAVSSKGPTHHGVGILSFIRFATKMTLFSRKNGIISVLSCACDGKDIVSETGNARELDPIEDREYEKYYRKLNKFQNEDGTLTVLEGVGQYESEKFKFLFNMEDVFKEKDFISWAQEKYGFSLTDHQYFLKKDETKKLTPIKAKVGIGKKITFNIPSEKHPYKKNVFELDNRFFDLSISGEFHVSGSNTGDIRISENHQNSLPIKDAIRGKKLAWDGVYKNPNFTQYINGFIDFKVKPLDGGEGINAFTGTRSALVIDGPFGDCLCNVLLHADLEILRPAIIEFIGRKDNKLDTKYEKRSRSLQNDIEDLFRERQDIFGSIIVTKSQGPVVATHVSCPRCKTGGIPNRRKNMEEVLEDHKIGTIYAPDDLPIYYCGSCGTRWPKRNYTSPDLSVIESNAGQPQTKPIYSKPEPINGVARRRCRGFGFTLQITPFQQGDTRRTTVLRDIVKVNRSHQDFVKLENEGTSRDLYIYERYLALEAIIEYELADRNKTEILLKLNECLATMFVFLLTRKREDKLKEEAENDSSEPAVKSEPVPVLEPKISRPVPKTVQDLKNKFNNR